MEEPFKTNTETPVENTNPTTFIKKIESVNEKNIQAAAKKYLLEKTSTTGWFISSQVKEN